MSRKTISDFHYVETITLPEFICESKAMFFHNILLSNQEYMHKIFNFAFQLAYQDGTIRKKEVFNIDEFNFCDIEYDDDRGMIQLKLPKPKLLDEAKIYYNNYYIPYMWQDNTIKILDLYAVETDGYSKNGIILRFKKGDSGNVEYFGVTPMPDVNNENAAISTIGFYAFERYINE